MKTVLNIKKAIEISKQLRKRDKSIVLAGGVFDILHTGHLKFLTNAKREGDILFVLLENDKNVRKLKGENRPINPQKERASLLSNLVPVDYVVLLPDMKSDKSYDKLISLIKPDVIAITQNDPGRKHKERQGKMINAKVKTVVKRLKNKSTTVLSKIIQKEI